MLPPGETQLSYYRNDERGTVRLGCIECTGATIFLKEVTPRGIHRFTLHSADRELKLRGTVSTSRVQPAAAQTLHSLYPV